MSNITHTHAHTDERGTDPGVEEARKERRVEDGMGEFEGGSTLNNTWILSKELHNYAQRLNLTITLFNSASVKRGNLAKL